MPKIDRIRIAAATAITVLAFTTPAANCLIAAPAPHHHSRAIASASGSATHRIGWAGVLASTTADTGTPPNGIGWD